MEGLLTTRHTHERLKRKGGWRNDERKGDGVWELARGEWQEQLRGVVNVIIVIITVR